MYLWISGDNYERWGGDGENRARVTLDLTPDLQSDETLNNSDKTFTVPADTEWTVQWIWLEFTTTAVVGARQIEIKILDDAADIIAELVPSLTQAASLTYQYLFSDSGPASEALRDGNQTHILSPRWILPAGYQMRIWDNNAVDAAADDLIIQMMVLSRPV